MMMTIRGLFSLVILACVGFLSLVLVDHLWTRYSQEADARGFAAGYERYPTPQAGIPGNPNADHGSADAIGARGSSAGREAFSE